MALRLQAAFGLRREEAIKFSPAYADRGEKIVLKASTTKGGRAREIQIWNDEQRQVLDDARRLAGGGALIPAGRNYAAQKKVYEMRTKDAGLRRMHGLRHYSGRRIIPNWHPTYGKKAGISVASSTGSG